MKIKDYIIEFTTNGSVTIKAKTKEEADMKLKSILESEEGLKDFDATIINAKITGFYNEDGSVNYLKGENRKDSLNISKINVSTVINPPQPQISGEDITKKINKLYIQYFKGEHHVKKNSKLT